MVPATPKKSFWYLTYHPCPCTCLLLTIIQMSITYFLKAGNRCFISFGFRRNITVEYISRKVQ